MALEWQREVGNKHSIFLGNEEKGIIYFAYRKWHLDGVGRRRIELQATTIEAAQQEAEALLRKWWWELGVALGELGEEVK